MSIQHMSRRSHCDQKHLRCTIVGPDSSYSPLEIHICWNVLNEDKIDPPIQTEYLRSGGATTLIFIVEGANAVNSFVIRSPIPANIVVPPDSTNCIQIFPDVHVALHDGLECRVMN